jgi:LPS sulfotransferase NodH
MKILILAQRRSGSTSLAKAIKDATGVTLLSEPFNPNDQDNDNYHRNLIVNSSDLIVKIVDSNFKLYKDFEDYRELTKYFDLVIGLTRKNSIENAKSYFVATITGDWVNGRKTHNIDEDFFKTESSCLQLKEYIEQSENNKNLILSYDIFQTTYEGLFITKTEINTLEEYCGFSIKNLNNMIQ